APGAAAAPEVQGALGTRPVAAAPQTVPGADPLADPEGPRGAIRAPAAAVGTGAPLENAAIAAAPAPRGGAAVSAPARAPVAGKGAERVALADPAANVAGAPPAPGAAAVPEAAAPSLPAAAEAGPEAETEPHDPEQPVFDIVRVSPDGSAVIAGRALPDSLVEVLLDGRVVASAQTNREGGFAAIADLGVIAEPKALQLRVERLESETSPALPEKALETAALDARALAEGAPRPAAPAPGGAADPARVPAPVPEPGHGAAPAARALGSGAPGAAATVAERGVPQLAAVVALAEPSPAGRPAETGRPEIATALPARDALAGNPRRYALSRAVVLLPPKNADRALQVVEPGPERVALLTPQPAKIDKLVLETLSYDTAGDATASGRAPAESRVRLYVNGRFLREVAPTSTGAWRVSLARAEAEGAALLRFDEIGPEGRVKSRLESGFDYDPGRGALEVREQTVIVERGDNLWRLSEQLYGDGWRYSVIFTANTALIRDPDLIYPDQEFVVPILRRAE
ncbi:MAG: hypothetical protein AAF074_15905, partial [Pseudomonadota bacterium]